MRQTLALALILVAVGMAAPRPTFDGLWLGQSTAELKKMGIQPDQIKKGPPEFGSPDQESWKIDGGKLNVFFFKGKSYFIFCRGGQHTIKSGSLEVARTGMTLGQVKKNLSKARWKSGPHPKVPRTLQVTTSGGSTITIGFTPGYPDDKSQVIDLSLLKKPAGAPW